jgi:hypothetical protein
VKKKHPGCGFWTECDRKVIGMDNSGSHDGFKKPSSKANSVDPTEKADFFGYCF